MSKVSARTAAPAAQSSAAHVGQSTPDRILDAAEELFGTGTFDGVSTRDISGRAGVNLALLSYHFGSKEALFERVVARRADALGAIRRDRLAALQAAGAPDVEAILDAFMRPMMQLLRGRDPGWRHYIRLLPQLGLGSRWFGLFERHFDDTARLFLGALRQALPGANPVLLQRGFHMILVTMLSIGAENRRIDTLSRRRLKADDLEGAYGALLAFSAAGLRGLAAAPASPPTRARRRQA